MSTAFLYAYPGDDDAIESAAGVVTLTDEFAEVSAAVPIIGLIFRLVPVPPGSTVTASLLRVGPTGDPEDAPDRNPNLTIRGELHPADFTTTANSLSARAKTAAGVVWEQSAAWEGIEAYVASPDISAVIQEIIDFGTWAEDDDLALFLIDRGFGGAYEIYLAEFGPGTVPAELFIEWTPPPVVEEELNYAWPHDYWPAAYWPEYWPDYGTASPPAGGVAVKYMHYQRQRRRRAL